MRRFFLFLSFLLFVFLFLQGNTSIAQETKKEYFPTPNTQLGAKPDPRKQKKKEKRIRYLITNDTRNTLAGNLCFEEVTTGMGFQYLAVPKGQSPNKNGWSRWWHNFGVKWIIVFKNGPWWKSKVNKKFDECKYGSGDFMGRLILEDVAQKGGLQRDPDKK